MKTKTKTKIIMILVVMSVLSIVTYRYLMEVVNEIPVSEDIKNYNLGEGIVFVELNYQGSVNVDIDKYWNIGNFDNGLPITAWEHFWLTDEIIVIYNESYMDFPNIETNDKMMVISLGRKLENLYYYKQSGYINLSSGVGFIGEPVFSKEYYDNTMFIYTSPEYITFPYYEYTDDNIRFNKDGDIPYEVRPYTKRFTDDGSILIRGETRLDVLLKKFKN